MSSSSSSTTPTQVLGGITVPKTPSIDAAIEYARAHSDDLTYNHIMRSFLFGFCIASRMPGLKDRDVEAHAVSAILHDLGWDSTGELVSDDKRFEVDSAQAARAFLGGLKTTSGTDGWDSRRLQLVWDAIALHSTTSIAQYKEPEVAACSLGVMADFGGPDQSQGCLTWDEYNSIVKEYPRLKLVTGVKKILCGICRTKPETTYDNFVASFGEKYVEGYTLQGHTTADIIGACTLEDSF